MKKHVFFIIIGFGVVIITLLSLKGNKENGGDYKKTYGNKYLVSSIQLPNNLSFANEKVPLSSVDVREAFDRELLVNTYWQSQTLLFIKRANKYFPVIEKVLKKNNIPDDFKYLTLIESELRNVVSPSGAVGVWQFLKGTAKDYGLEVNKEVDERYHLEKSTEAACKYLSEAYMLFGSWTMAAASYNVGKKGLMKQVVRQKQNNYYNLLLNEETARYVYRILAVKTILESPNEYGFHVRKQDLYYPVSIGNVEVDSSVTNFVDFAKYFSISYKTLKYFNPWLRDSYLTNKSKKKYYIRIPKESSFHVSCNDNDVSY
ncbi:MAG: lytic transglycosylase domain-containing protein [Bacteroidales bacterium]|nr:lytic transglycosylase domain-containing protein [Bacteroidales bacterium]